MAPTLAQAVEIAAGKAFVILDGTLLRIDRLGCPAVQIVRSTTASTNVTG